jgi:hypothetical protein
MHIRCVECGKGFRGMRRRVLSNDNLYGKQVAGRKVQKKPAGLGSRTTHFYHF